LSGSFFFYLKKEAVFRLDDLVWAVIEMGFKLKELINIARARWIFSVEFFRGCRTKSGKILKIRSFSDEIE